MPHLTTQTIARFRTPESRTIVSDDAVRGLYLVVEPSGTKRFLLRYKTDGETHRHTLGTFGTADQVGRLTLDAARSMASAWRDRIKQGELPHEVKATERENRAMERHARSSGATLKDLVNEFETKYLQKKTKRPEYRLSSFRKYVIPWRPEKSVAPLGNRKVADIRPAHLESLLEELVEAGKDKIAYTLARQLRQIFKFARKRRIIEISPATDLDQGRPHDPRQRVLDDDEIRNAWTTLDTAALPMSAQIRIALKILLMTGARSGELCAARWADVQLDGDMPTWTIPREAAKTGAAHLIPLGPTSVELFRQLQTLSGDTVYVLPAGDRLMGLKRAKPRKRPPSDHLTSHAVATALRRCNDRGKFGKMPAFGAHDLRRTMRTGLVKPPLNTSIDLAERVIGHKPRNILLETYDLYDRLPERRKALLDWDAQVQRILAGKSNVVSFKKKRA